MANTKAVGFFTGLANTVTSVIAAVPNIVATLIDFATKLFEALVDAISVAGNAVVVGLGFVRDALDTLAERLVAAFNK